MPDPTVKEARPAVLRLPRMRRDQIIKALSEVRLPDIDLTKIDLPRLELPEAAQAQIAKSRADLASIDIPKAIAAIDVPKAVSNLDLPKAIAAPLVAAGIVKPPRRRRWPYALVGVIVAGIVATFLVKQASGRMRMGETARAARERAEAITDGDGATFDPLASNGMPTDDIAVAIEPGAHAAGDAETDAVLVFEASDSAV
jgi:hypothetical protein